ncbi:MAG: type II toxin-antitoxin system VapB family antitoxin [Pseudobdellovibrionaceae bacterium]|nr:type II toxin-antitoxin system VapB family antitoxin [Bdellovibrionales bacterium]USN47931.1 MAG: type II toxin-antitoxin system VapB family antitoxin [Pseudobdellovibrionaceae bacterium]
MPTNLALDDELIEKAKEVGNHPTKKEAVTVALQEYIRNKKQKEILKLFGGLEFNPEYNYKKQRAKK